ncbi:MAG: heavy-metal-associated domain-containing protein [Spirochaetaceae bacterium]|nr:MAG: heavy-metal-associated domain-containing protein [Spirochaetaceae bacterium]
MNTTTEKKAILDLNGAHCTSCSIAIEHFGKKLEGVHEIYVDRGNHTINLAYDGNEKILTQLCDLVAKLGYEAHVRSSE